MGENIWKCFEWIIYLCLMAIAILLAREVIKKYFGKNTGIKQNMEKIDSHPTITICPFQNKCMKLILGLPGLPGIQGEHNALFKCFCMICIVLLHLMVILLHL